MSLSQAAVLELLLCGLRKPTDRPQLLFEFTADPSWDQISLGCKHTLNWEERPGDGSTDCVNAFTCTSLRIVSFNTVMVLIFFFFLILDASPSTQGKKNLDVCRKKLLFRKLSGCAFQRIKRRKKNLYKTLLTQRLFIDSK